MFSTFLLWNPLCFCFHGYQLPAYLSRTLSLNFLIFAIISGMLQMCAKRLLQLCKWKLESSDQGFEIGCCYEDYHFVCFGVCTSSAGSVRWSKGFCPSIVEGDYQSKSNYYNIVQVFVEKFRTGITLLLS